MLAEHILVNFTATFSHLPDKVSAFYIFLVKNIFLKASVRYF